MKTGKSLKRPKDAPVDEINCYEGDPIICRGKRMIVANVVQPGWKNIKAYIRACKINASGKAMKHRTYLIGREWSHDNSKVKLALS